MTKLRNCCVVAVIAMGLQACVVVDEGSQGYEGLVINWTIDGSSAAILCDDLAIDFWEIDLVGPERVGTDVLCGEPWSTDNEFTGGGAVLTGTYDATITAVDFDGLTITSSTIDGVIVDEFDALSPDVYEIDLDGADFL